MGMSILVKVFFLGFMFFSLVSECDNLVNEERITEFFKKAMTNPKALTDSEKEELQKLGWDESEVDDIIGLEEVAGPEFNEAQKKTSPSIEEPEEPQEVPEISPLEIPSQDIVSEPIVATEEEILKVQEVSDVSISEETMPKPAQEVFPPETEIPEPLDPAQADPEVQQPLSVQKMPIEEKVADPEVVSTVDKVPEVAVKPIAEHAPMVEVAPVEKPKIEEDVELKDVMMIDTVDMEKGNWLYKRMWLEKFLNKYEKASLVAQRTIKLETEFYKKRNEVDKNLFDPFYISSGLQRGELKEIVTHMMDKFKKLREKEVTLNPEEKALLGILYSKEKTLEQLNLDVEAIRKLDTAIVDVLDVLRDQINKSIRYKEQALELFKQISRELDHKKAEAIFYKMDALWKNISNIEKYIQGRFAQHFDSMIASAEQHVTRIKAAMEELKVKGIDLKDQWKKLEQGAVEKESEETEHQEEVTEDVSEGLLGLVWKKLSSPIKVLWDWISSWWR